jgi:hypothetical protein
MTDADEKLIDEAVQACWRVLSDLDFDQKVMALAKLDELFGREWATYVPETAPGKTH